MLLESLITLFSDPQTYVSLFSLAALLIVLDMDNVIFISILTADLPANQQPKARRIGLGIGVLIRAVLLIFVGYLTQFKEPLITILGAGLSVKNLIMIAGGLFLLYKATTEIHHKLEGVDEKSNKADTFGQVLVQITILDTVFSVDAVITAVGMVEQIQIMLVAMLISVLLMFVFQKAISEFVQKHPTMKMLALSFLILIGVFLLIEGLHLEVPKGYIYFAMAFSFAVELLNMRYRKKTQTVKLRGPKLPKLIPHVLNNRKIYLIIGIVLLAMLVGIILFSNRGPSAYQKSILAHRTKLDNFFKQDKRSPLLDPDKQKFKGLTYFEPDSTFRFLATFTRDTTPQLMPPKTDSIIQVRAGTVSFQFQDKTYTLTAYWQRIDSERELFVPFRDGTSGKTTYGGGRFLNAALNQDFKTVSVDFNMAYNPYCAFNPSYLCPIPPPENTLKFEVNAGENGFATPKAQ